MAIQWKPRKAVCLPKKELILKNLVLVCMIMSLHGKGNSYFPGGVRFRSSLCVFGDVSEIDRFSSILLIRLVCSFLEEGRMFPEQMLETTGVKVRRRQLGQINAGRSCDLHHIRLQNGEITAAERQTLFPARDTLLPPLPI